MLNNATPTAICLVISFSRSKLIHQSRARVFPKYKHSLEWSQRPGTISPRGRRRRQPVCLHTHRQWWGPLVRSHQTSKSFSSYHKQRKEINANNVCSAWKYPACAQSQIYQNCWHEIINFEGLMASESIFKVSWINSLTPVISIMRHHGRLIKMRLC